MKRSDRVHGLVLSLRACLSKHLAREQRLLAHDAHTADRAKARSACANASVAAAAADLRGGEDEGWHMAGAEDNGPAAESASESSDSESDDEGIEEDANADDGKGAPGWLPPWTVCYHALVCLERCAKALPSDADKAALMFQRRLHEYAHGIHGVGEAGVVHRSIFPDVCTAVLNLRAREAGRVSGGQELARTTGTIICEVQNRRQEAIWARTGLAFKKSYPRHQAGRGETKRRHH
jgi:hypothetical protein